MKKFFSIFIFFINISFISYASFNILTDARYYIDEENKCIFPVWENWEYMRGKGNVKIITRDSEGFKFFLYILSNKKSFVPMIYSGEDLSSVIDEIKKIDQELLKKSNFQGYEIINEDYHYESDSSKHILLTWIEKTGENIILQDVICGNKNWYIIKYTYPTIKDLNKIANKYFQCTVDFFLSDLVIQEIGNQLNEIRRELSQIYDPESLVQIQKWPFERYYKKRIQFPNEIIN